MIGILFKYSVSQETDLCVEREMKVFCSHVEGKSMCASKNTVGLSLQRLNGLDYLRFKSWQGKVTFLILILQTDYGDYPPPCSMGTEVPCRGYSGRGIMLNTQLCTHITSPVYNFLSPCFLSLNKPFSLISTDNKL